MTFSVRTLLIAVVVASALALLAAKLHQRHQWYNHEVAEFELESGHRIRVWASYYWPGHDERQLRYEVRQGRKLVIPSAVLKNSFCTKTDQIEAITAQKGFALAIVDRRENQILLIGDLRTNRFISNSHLEHQGVDADQLDWRTLEEQILQAHRDRPLTRL